MADDNLNPRSGGNPLLDQAIDADPTIMNRLIKAGMQPAQEAYKTLYGTDFPSFSLLSGTQDSREAFIKNHAELQHNIMTHMSNNMLDPTYGASRRSFNDAAGDQPPGSNIPGGQSRMSQAPPLASPTPQPAQAIPQPSIQDRTVDPVLPGAAPPGFSGNYTMGPDESGWAPKDPIRDWNHPSVGVAPTATASASPTLAPPPQPGEEDRPMNSVERAFAGSEIQRRKSPYFGMLRGKFANTQAMLHQSALALGLEPGTEEYNNHMAQGYLVGSGVLKGTAQPGSVEADSAKASTDLKKAITEKTEIGNKALPQAIQDKHNDILSRIEARGKTSKDIHDVHQSMINLRNSQTAINEAKRHGQMPEQEIAAMEADRKQAKDDLLKQVFILLDKGKIAPDEVKDIVGTHILEDVGIEGVESKPHANVLKRAGQATGLIDEPQSTYTPPVKGKAQSMLKEKQRGATPDYKDHPKAQDAGEHLKALQQQIGDLSKHEGQMFDDTATGRRYKVQGGGLVEVNK